MRTVAHVPHPLMRITINHWNDKYYLRYELDRYEQTYKFDADVVSSRTTALNAWPMTCSNALSPCGRCYCKTPHNPIS